MQESTVEEQLAYRQLNVKSIAWYIQIRAILLKYNLPLLWICSVLLFQSISESGYILGQQYS